MRGLHHTAAVGQTRRKHNGDCDGGQCECIRKPALEPIRELKTDARQPRTHLFVDGLHAGEIIHRLG